ncbi:MAG: ABC transporter ATP-binding protein, partial [Actinobacteria bacterium]
MGCGRSCCPAAGGASVSAAPRRVFEIDGLDVEYTTEAGVLRAVRDVSLVVHEHESFGLVGESGSGKSTLAMGAIRYLASNGRVTAGRVRLNGVELLDLSPRELRELWGSKIGVVYQSPLSALNPSIVIGRQLAEVARQPLGMERAAARERVQEMLAKVAMPDPESVMKRYPHQLSGGMLQRCVIAMALMTNPSLLIMDEPTTALDVTTQAVVLDLVAELKREFDSAILYITHDLGVITKICDRVGVMYAGQFMEQASLRRLFKRPRHPYTLDLLGCVPHFEPSPQKRSLVTIPGSIPRLDELPAGCIFSPRCKYVQDACRVQQPTLVLVEEA